MMVTSPDKAAPTEESMLENAVAFWQPRARRALTAEDARQIIENLRGFFEVLDEWERTERQATDGCVKPFMP
jgi:hypothetical protein